MKWWQKTVVYECYPKSFKDTKGQGTGTLKGLQSELEYLSKLGVGAVWITPVYKSPMVDNGYDIGDYYDIDPSYGTMAEMEELIAEGNKYGIKMVMDLVYNHTSNENAWFLESKKSKDNPKSDWYIWRDAKPDGSAPTNWRGIFGGSAWEWCEERGQYYLHTFAAAQPDLNWANPEVRAELRKITNFWIDKGVGGFRVDAITYIKKPDVFADGPVDGEDGMCGIHEMTANSEGILDYLAEYKAGINKTDIFMVAEANGVAAEELPIWVGENGVFDMLMEFSHTSLQFKNGQHYCRIYDWSLTELKKALNDSQENTKTNGWYPIFFENHDQPRSINHYFKEGTDPVKAAKALATLLYTMRGTPFVFQGEELGYTNATWTSPEEFNDIETKGHYQFALDEGFTPEQSLKFCEAWSRDNARTPMQWDDSLNAGFTTGTPWLPVHKDYKDQNVALEEKDPDSVLNWYRTLAEFRKNTPVLTEGDYTPILEDSEEIIGFVRKSADDCVTVLVNYTGDVQEIEDGTCLISTCAHENGKLQPYEAVVIRK